MRLNLFLQQRSPGKIRKEQQSLRPQVRLMGIYSAPQNKNKN